MSWLLVIHRLAGSIPALPTTLISVIIILLESMVLRLIIMLPWRGRRETMTANGIVSYTVDSPRQSGDHDGAFHYSLSVRYVMNCC